VNDIDLQEKELILLENKINKAQNEGKPVDKYVLREIEILQNSIDKYIEKMKEAEKLYEPQVAEIEIRQYATMRNLAQKIGLPAAPYDEKIKQVQIRIFGEENWENFFGV